MQLQNYSKFVYGLSMVHNKIIKPPTQMVLSHRIPRDRRNMGSISADNMLLDTLKADGISTPNAVTQSQCVQYLNG